MTKNVVTLAATLGLKESGNDAFKKQRFAKAIIVYDFALNFLKNSVEEEDLKDPETKNVLVALYSNKAEALLKLGAFALAKRTCEYALHYDPHHTKSIHRKKRAAEAERLYNRDVAILHENTKELAEDAAGDDFHKTIEYIAGSTKFRTEKMGVLSHVQCLSLRAGLYWVQFNVTGSREYLEPAARVAQNCIELCEPFTNTDKRYEIDPATLDPKYSLAELLMKRAECSMLAARLTECMTGDRSAAAAKMAIVVAQLSDVFDMANEYDTIVSEVAKKKLEAFAAIVELETASQRWTKAKTAAEKAMAIFKEQITTEEFVHAHADKVTEMGASMMEGPDGNREVTCLAFYAVADGYFKHDRYEDAAQVIRKLITTRRGSWGICKPFQSPLPPNEAEKRKDADDTKTLLSLLDKAGRVPGSTCSICMESLDSDVIVATKCLHVFHSRCICTLFKNNPKAVRRESEAKLALDCDCPNCRESIEAQMQLKR